MGASCQRYSRLRYHDSQSCGSSDADVPQSVKTTFNALDHSFFNIATAQGFLPSKTHHLEPRHRRQRKRCPETQLQRRVLLYHTLEIDPLHVPLYPRQWENVVAVGSRVLQIPASRTISHHHKFFNVPPKLPLWYPIYISTHKKGKGKARRRKRWRDLIPI